MCSICIYYSICIWKCRHIEHIQFMYTCEICVYIYKNRYFTCVSMYILYLCIFEVYIYIQLYL